MNKIKINAYYRNGERVQSHTRHFKTHCAVKSTNMSNRNKRLLELIIWFGFIVCFGGMALHGTYNVIPTETKEVETPIETTLNKEQGFEQVAPVNRDTVERDYRKDVTDKEYVKSLIRQNFGKDADNAIKIADCESDFVYNKHNGNSSTRDDSWGIFQINRFGKLALTRPNVDQLIDPEFNIKYAKTLFDSTGKWSINWTVCSRLNGLK